MDSPVVGVDDVSARIVALESFRRAVRDVFKWSALALPNRPKLLGHVRGLVVLVDVNVQNELVVPLFVGS
jgi:hypothetical protein